MKFMSLIPPAAALACILSSHSALAAVENYQISGTYNQGGVTGTANVSFSLDKSAAPDFTFSSSTYSYNYWFFSAATVTFDSPIAGWGPVDLTESVYYQTSDPSGAGTVPTSELSFYDEDLNYFTIELGAAFSDSSQISVLGTSEIGHSGGFTSSVGDFSYAGGTVSLATAVPEPESYAMLLAGLGVLGAMNKRRRRAA